MEQSGSLLVVHVEIEVEQEDSTWVMQRELSYWLVLGGTTEEELSRQVQADIDGILSVVLRELGVDG